jgi:hypothetical protein
LIVGASANFANNAIILGNERSLSENCKIIGFRGAAHFDKAFAGKIDREIAAQCPGR